MSNPAHPEGVPLNIWLFNNESAPVSPTGLRRHLAARLIDAYSPPGGVVVDLAPGRGEVLAAAVEAGRSAVVSTTAALCKGRWKPAALDSATDSADVVVALPPAKHLAPLRPHSVSSFALEILLRRAAPLLRPGGFMVVGFVGGAAVAHRDRLAVAVNAAASEGLSYFQHIVAVLASCADGTPDPATPPPLPDLMRMASTGPSPHTSPPSGTAGARRQAHIDLLVLRRRER